jgi:hypothetical protein
LLGSVGGRCGGGGGGTSRRARLGDSSSLCDLSRRLGRLDSRITCCLADCSAAAAAAGRTAPCGLLAISTFGLPVPGVSGEPCIVTSRSRAAGRPAIPIIPNCPPGSGPIGQPRRRGCFRRSGPEWRMIIRRSLASSLREKPPHGTSGRCAARSPLSSARGCEERNLGGCHLRADVRLAPRVGPLFPAKITLIRGGRPTFALLRITRARYLQPTCAILGRCRTGGTGGAREC